MTSSEHSRASLALAMASAHDPAADTGASAGAVAQPADEQHPREGPLARTFRRIVESLPDDWTDLELDLRIADESRYVEAAVMLSQVNAQPYSKADWHWRILVAHRFGHAAAPETVKGVLAKLDREGIGGEMRVRDAQEGRAEVVQWWGRPESGRQDFLRRRS